ncbi:hypothetical protein [Spiroplasma citri]|uniref:hypothetical protein n=1 Tax=Spiroplasma citri TaxID=2133 RepID=UPI0011BBCD23|nr:hypothetical protein [Spiroplasma citri]QED25591.1 hypothetical protein FRX96_09950 [Spiroplasma citri]
MLTDSCVNRYATLFAISSFVANLVGVQATRGATALVVNIPAPIKLNIFSLLFYLLNFLYFIFFYIKL